MHVNGISMVPPIYYSKGLLVEFLNNSVTDDCLYKLT